MGYGSHPATEQRDELLKVSVLCLLRYCPSILTSYMLYYMFWLALWKTVFHYTRLCLWVVMVCPVLCVCPFHRTLKAKRSVVETE